MPVSAAVQAGQRVAQFRLTVAVDAGERQDLAAAQDLKLDVLQPAQAGDRWR